MEKAIFALCPIIPKNKKKIDSLFCLKILDTICWGRNAWQSSKIVCVEGKDQKDVFNAELYNSNRRSSVNSFSYEWSFSKQFAVYFCPFILRQEPFLRFPEISQIFHVNVLVESGFVSCTATYSYQNVTIRTFLGSFSSNFLDNDTISGTLLHVTKKAFRWITRNELSDWQFISKKSFY